jgi:hypothetical protein
LIGCETINTELESKAPPTSEATDSEFYVRAWKNLHMPQGHGHIIFLKHVALGEERALHPAIRTPEIMKQSMIIQHIAFVKGTVDETQRIITVAFLFYFNLDMMQLQLKISDVVHIYCSPDRLAKIHWPVSCARKAVLSIQYW